VLWMCGVIGLHSRCRHFSYQVECSRQEVSEKYLFVYRRLVSFRCLTVHEGKRVLIGARESLQKGGVWSWRG
jgi:hypothetical protein